MGRPIEHTEERERTLLVTAARLLATEGADALTVRRVAEGAGTTTRAVYARFGGKSGLLRGLYLEAAETMRRAHEAVPPSDDLMTEVTDLASAYRRAASEHPHAYGLLMEGSVPGFVPAPEDRRVAIRSLERVAEALERANSRGEVAGVDPIAAARQLWAQVHGLASLERQGLLGSPDEAAALWRSAIAAHVDAFRAAGAGLVTEA